MALRQSDKCAHEAVLNTVDTKLKLRKSVSNKELASLPGGNSGDFQPVISKCRQQVNAPG